MSGSFDKALEKVFVKEVADTYLSRGDTNRSKTNSEDIGKFVNGDNLHFMAFTSLAASTTI